ncbi:MAG: phage baseplate assembly protein V [Oscillospiraceae bacterium]|jgi:uncharacterized protein involved in type VI secretion and phage assembly|nr:phage baseplate assembly protein V [Oscillospiraceae bacterium]
MSISDSLEIIAKKSAKKTEREDTIIPGIIVGTVLEIGVGENHGKIKVEITVRDENNFYWMRVISSMAGNSWGMFLMPEIGDTVFVAFIAGNIANPVVLGCDYHQNSKVSQKFSDSNNSNKVLVTKGGNQITINDKTNEQEVKIATPNHSISLDEKNKKIELSDKNGKNKIQLSTEKGNLEITTTNEITVKVNNTSMVFNGINNTVSVKCGKFTIDAAEEITFNTSQLKTDGGTIDMKASGETNIFSGGITSIKGTFVKFN